MNPPTPPTTPPTIFPTFDDDLCWFWSGSDGLFPAAQTVPLLLMQLESRPATTVNTLLVLMISFTPRSGRVAAKRYRPGGTFVNQSYSLPISLLMTVRLRPRLCGGTALSTAAEVKGSADDDSAVVVSALLVPALLVSAPLASALLVKDTPCSVPTETASPDTATVSIAWVSVVSALTEACPSDCGDGLSLCVCCAC